VDDLAVEIWRVELDRSPAPPRGLLSAAEQERAERLRDRAAGQRWAVSRWALRELLGRRLDRAPAAVELALGERGKPRLAEPAGLEFNLSHSGGLAVVALATLPVGVDVEAVVPRGRDLAALAARALPPAEAAAIAAAEADERPALFFAAWTRHEARLKCGGGGFGAPPPSEPVTVAELELGADYAGAVAIAGERPPLVQLYRLDLR
jgi:4'-phosphopantetheinyl transferase